MSSSGLMGSFMPVPSSHGSDRTTSSAMSSCTSDENTPGWHPSAGGAKHVCCVTRYSLREKAHMAPPNLSMSSCRRMPRCSARRWSMSSGAEIFRKSLSPFRLICCSTLSSSLRSFAIMLSRSSCFRWISSSSKTWSSSGISNTITRAGGPMLASMSAASPSSSSSPSSPPLRL